MPSSKLPTYRIGAAARLSGLSEHIIRIWERRYGAVQPHRTPSGVRLYSELDVTRLRYLKRATERGHAIGGIAALDTKQLERLGGEGPPGLWVEVSPEAAGAPLIEELLGAVEAMDLSSAQAVIGRADVSLGPRGTALSVLLPALREVGDRWERGDFSVAQEHAAASVVRDYLGAVLRALGRNDASPLALITTPPGELHEFGALVAAVYAASHGVRAVYLGPNLPTLELVETTLTLRARVVLLSAVAKKRGLEAFLSELRAKLPAKVPIVVGGAAAEHLEHLPSGVIRLERVDQLDPVLAEVLHRG